jgi:predicted ABC-type ATPase
VTGRPHAPLVVVLAGPNGAGKSTNAANLLRGALAVDEFVNADTIAQGLSAYRPESTAVTAGRVMLERLRVLVRGSRDFAFETTLAGRNHARWLTEARAAGSRAHLIFLSLPSPDLAVARVHERVKRGGHSVPEEVIRRRYEAGLRNLFDVYVPVVDGWQLYDNAGVAAPRLIAAGVTGTDPVIVDRDGWNSLRALR